MSAKTNPMRNGAASPKSPIRNSVHDPVVQAILAVIRGAHR